MPKEWGFAITSLGMIADFQARAIAAMTGGRLVACYSRRADAVDAFAEKFDCKPYYAYDKLLADPEVEIVTVCTASGAHNEYAIPAAEAGKHIIVEKPLEVTLERCDAVIEAAEAAGVELGCVFPSRFVEASALAKKAIEAGRLGRITLADAYVKWWRPQEYYDSVGWRGTVKLDGGGALMNQSIHAIDLLQWLAGPVESVVSVTGTLAHKRIEVEDTAVAALRFANGALGTIEGTTSAWPGFLKRIEISGDTGTIMLEEDRIVTWKFAEELPEDDSIRQKFASEDEFGGGASDPSAIDFRKHQRNFEAFIDALDAGRHPDLDGREGRKAVEIILAVYKAARRGGKVTLPL
ncbi:MAG: Gfo/Idh/MocA family oxidoreductase [Planctomycetes bacterium]|nr:Gfo/Idh/MocA family oxidoreductase [Planctomycetota bacterium]